MRSLNIKKLSRKHICSVRGCGNKETVLFARSSDLAGGIFICRDCVAELSSFFFPPEEEKTGTAAGSEETAAESEETAAESAESDVSPEAVQEKRFRGRSEKK